MDGEGPQPLAFYLSRVCEEFHCLPSQAWAEGRRLPEGLLGDIIEARYFARAFWAYQSTRNKQDLPADDPMIALVRELTFDQARRELANRA